MNARMLTTFLCLGTWISYRGKLNGFEEGHNFSISNCDDFHARWWLLRKGKLFIQLPIQRQDYKHISLNTIVHCSYLRSTFRHVVNF